MVETNQAAGERPGVRRPYLASLQALRALAATAVVFAHISVFITGADPPQYFPNWFIGNIGVDVFFIVSGFTMVYTTRDDFGRPGAPQRFFWHRLVRIVPLYWAVTTFVLYEQRNGLRGSLAVLQSSVANLLGSYFFIPIPRTDGSNAPIVLVGWTLCYEMYFYVIFAVATAFRNRGIALACVVAFLVATAQFNRFIQPADHPVLATWTSGLIIEFAMGIGLALLQERNVRLPPVVCAAGVALGIALLIIWKPWWSAGLGFYRFIQWGVPSLLFVASFVLVRDTPLTKRLFQPLSVLGDASYALYLTHLYVIAWPLAFVGIQGRTQPWLAAAVALVFALVVSIVVHWTFERSVTTMLRSRWRL